MSGNQAFLAADLYSKGSSFKEVGTELGISKSKVGDLIREGISTMVQDNGGSDGSLSVPEEDPERDVPLLDEIWEKTMLIQATPILRKVVLNSKVFLQHEYFVKHLGYEKDVGDLLVEALDFYWREMGFSIRVTHDSVV